MEIVEVSRLRPELKEPHKTLVEHMADSHGKTWSNTECRFEKALDALKQEAVDAENRLKELELCAFCGEDKSKHTSFGLCAVNGVTSQYFTPKNPPEPKCEMCGVPFAEHDGLTLMCRRYHRLRAEIMSIMNRSKEKSSQFLANANREVWDIVGQLEWALDAAANNYVEDRK